MSTLNKIRSSSTLLLLADCASDAFKVLMVKRVSKARFMPSFYVFPGGCVEPDDHRAAASLPSLPNLGVFRVAAVRELFEEAGLALKGNGVEVRKGGEADPIAVRWDAAAMASLVPFARWITPEQEYKYRYETLFFTHCIKGACPDARELQVDKKEIEDICWITPNDARAEAPRRLCIPAAPSNLHYVAVLCQV